MIAYRLARYGAFACVCGYNDVMDCQLFDMHCHVDFLAESAAFAAAAAQRGLGFFSNTVEPAGFIAARREFSDSPNVVVGAGLHPWWLHDGRCNEDDAERLCALVGKTRYVGEVGLDFGKRCASSRELQLAAFERIAATCAQQGNKLLSIHAVHSADTVLDVLERTGCLANNQCIFHWYSDSNPALWRAIRAGCFFSVNMRMLSTKRGREYAKLIPTAQLLIETDLPPDGTDFPLDAWETDLRLALHILEEVRGEELADVLARNSQQLLNTEL